MSTRYASHLKVKVSEISTELSKSVRIIVWGLETEDVQRLLNSAISIFRITWYHLTYYRFLFDFVFQIPEIKGDYVRTST